MHLVNGSLPVLPTLRRPDWPLLLEVYVERHRETAFAWGAHDCVSFAIGWLECVRPDLDVRAGLEAVGYRLDYVTAAQALRAYHGRTLTEAIDAWGELEPISPAYARRGDLVLVDVEGRHSVAVCTGDHAAGPGERCLELVPMSAARVAWRV